MTNTLAQIIVARVFAIYKLLTVLCRIDYFSYKDEITEDISKKNHNNTSKLCNWRGN